MLPKAFHGYRVINVRGEVHGEIKQESERTTLPMWYIAELAWEAYKENRQANVPKDDDPVFE